jgi:cobalt/nickel transport system permease protein
VILIGSSVSGPFPLVDAMGRLGCPERLVAVLRLCLRYMDLLSEELSRLQRARQSRGCAEPGLAFQARITGQLVGTLFLRSLGRAERVEVAMRSRGGVAGTFASPPIAGRWGLAETSIVGLSAAVAGISWTW